MKIKDGFLDWNTLTLEQMVEYLEKKYQFSSTGEAKCIFSLIEFYKEQQKVLKTINKFYDIMHKQEDCPAEILEFVDENFWDLI